MSISPRLRPRFRLALELALPFAALALLPAPSIPAAPGDLLVTIPDPVGEPGAQFGECLATDGSTVAVGAPFTVTIEGFSGAVYLYGTSGVFQQRVTAPSIVPDERFGSAIAIGDSTLLVGAPGNNTAYAYDGTTTHTLVSLDSAAGDAFGSSVAILPDFWAVGAPNMVAGLELDAGAVHLFDHSGNETMILNAPSPFIQGWFGRSVAAVGPNLLVGAPGQLDPATGTPRGLAFLYDFDPGTPAPDGTLLVQLSDPGPGDYGSFGESMTAAGGETLRAVIGNSDDPGRALLFDLDPASAGFGVLLTTLGNPRAGSSSYFGMGVAAHADKIFVGAPNHDSIGAVYLFDGDPGSDTFGVPILTIDNPTPSAGEWFGGSLAAPEDARLFVGAKFEAPGGAVHLFDTGGTVAPAPSTVVFNIDSGFSDFNVTVFGDGGSSFTFQPGISGTITVRIFEEGGSQQSVQIVSADLHMEDVTSDVPFPFQLTGLGAVLGPGIGVPGPPVLLDPSGGFSLFGNQVVLQGTATSDLGGAEPFVWTGGFGLVPIDISGSLAGSGGGAFTIDAPFNLSRTVPGTGASFLPQLQAFGTVSLEETIPVGLSEFSLE